VQALDTVLTELEDRGLVGWDRSSNRYDLHPIVRGVVWNGLDDLGRKDVYGTLEQHFSAVSAGYRGVDTFDEASPVIELFTALVGLGRYDQACQLYFDRLHGKNFSFIASGRSQIDVSLLESLFPDGPHEPPMVEPDRVPSILGRLSSLYAAVGRITEALSFARRGLAAYRRSKHAHHEQISRYARELGRLREAIEAAQHATSERRGNSRSGTLAIAQATVGKSDDALILLHAEHFDTFYDPREHEAQIQLWLGEYARAKELAQAALPWAEPFYPHRLALNLILAEAQMGLGHVDDAVIVLFEVLREGRAKGLVAKNLHFPSRIDGTSFKVIPIAIYI
jgi:tetratricopeptide (TPR) repeat protein